MRRIIEIPTTSGQTILVETDANDAPTKRGLVPKELSGEVMQSFEAGIDRVRPAAEAIVASLRAAIDRPNEIEVAFGIKVSAEAGAFIASASSEANFAVTLRWRDKASA